MPERVLRPDRVLVLLGLGALLWLLGDVLLVVFAGLLVAVALDGGTSLVAKYASITRGWALIVVLALVVLFAILGTTTIIVPMIEQLREVWQQLPGAMDRATDLVAEHLELELSLTPGEVVAEAASHIAPASAAILGAAISVVIAAVVGLFVAINPELYRRGVLRLFPAERRPRLDQVISGSGRALRWWLVGQACSMAILGTVTALTLWLLDVPLWLGLGLLTAVLTFVPYFGPLIAAVPILLFSFSEGLETGAAVLAIYVVLQNVEGFLMTPAIQQRAVRLPPALLISMQIAMGALFGPVGLILAAPFTAFAMVAVKALYVEDVIERAPLVVNGAAPR